jgi:hypothetical protein
MRVNPIRSYNGLNSAPRNKQVSFGLIENEENTKRVLPKNSDYRIPFDKQWEYLKNHDAITVTSDGNKASARINPGFEEMYKFLSGQSFVRINYLVDLEKQGEFDSFYRMLQSLDCDRAGTNPQVSQSGGSVEKSAFDEATEGGFGVKVW